LKRFVRYALNIVPVVALVVTWEIVARMELVPHYMFPPFTEVALRAYQLTCKGFLPYNFVRSLIRVLIGFSMGSVAGISLGILMGLNKAVYGFSHPILALFYAIPALGWTPLLMMWLGLGEALPIALIFICSFFPLLYNTITGIKTVDADLIKAAKTLGASDKQILTTIVLPLAIPNIFTGLRLESGMAWRVVIAAEMIAIPVGIGALAVRAESLMQIDVILVTLAVLSLTGLVFDKIFQYAESKICKWRA
jgi:NitT/TauT family transport system permease protein